MFIKMQGTTVIKCLCLLLLQSQIGELSLVRNRHPSILTVLLHDKESVRSQLHSVNNTVKDGDGDKAKQDKGEVSLSLTSTSTSTKASPVVTEKHEQNTKFRNSGDFQFVEANRITISEKNELRAINYAKTVVHGMRANHRKENEREKSRVNKWEDLENNMNNIDYTRDKTPKKLVCYYNAPTFQDRPFAVFPEQIGPSLCTHIIVGFAHITPNLTIVPSDLKDLEYYNRTLKLKSSNNDLKVMLSIGGARNDSCFPEMVANNNTRATFIKNAMEFLNMFPFDGIDFDWEFPAWDGPIEEKDQLILFFQEFREHTEKSGRPIILTAAVASPKPLIDISYDIPKLARVLDFVNLMAYDYHFYQWYTPFTGPNAPLFGSKEDVGIFATLNTAWSAKYWYENGMPANKIVVGTPTYGHTYKLVDRREHSYMSLAMDIGTVGSGGYINYPEICEFIATNGTQVVFDNVTQVPYTFNDRNWISFDNEESAKRKAQWVNEFDLGGMMVYCINSEDAWKMCNTSQTTFPIINAIKTELFSGSSSNLSSL